MNKLFCLLLIGSVFTYGLSPYTGSTLSAVTLAGGIIKASHTENTKKFKRKNCPVCKGKGWYISGDKISKVDCGYCEPDNEDSSKTQDPNCPTKVIKR